MQKGSRLASFIFSGLLTFFISYCSVWCLDPSNLPIRSVVFIGDRNALDAEDLQNALVENIDSGFFKTKVSRLQEVLLRLPWIKQADVRKAWPNKLVIRFEEHMPVARWGDKGLMSESGYVFYPKTLPEQQYHALPQLKGPSTKAATVWKNYCAMKSILSEQDLIITQLTLAARGSWQLELNNGTKIVLGTVDPIKRLKRFVRIYKTHLQSAQQSPDYIDLQYTSGLAVGWRTT